MLEPQERLSVYDILRPPTGFAIDVLIACTYSASLDTVLSLPTAMLADLPGMAKRKPGIFTAVELAALKRVCDRTLIFCQGGAIHPAEYMPPAIIEAELMVHEVKAPMGGPSIRSFGSFASSIRRQTKLYCVSQFSAVTLPPTAPGIWELSSTGGRFSALARRMI
jgi:hypothetical protein